MTKSTKTKKNSNISSDDSGFGTLGDRLPTESRESLEELIDGSTGYVRRARNYVMANPVKSAGIALLGAGALWALFGTKRGRGVIDAGRSAVGPAVDGIVSGIGGLGAKVGLGGKDESVGAQQH